MGKDIDVPGRVNRDPAMVSSALCREQRRGIRHAAQHIGRNRLGQVVAESVPHSDDRRTGLLHPLSEQRCATHTARGDSRTGADYGRCHRQPDRLDVLRHDLHGIDTLKRSHAGRGIQRVPDG